MLYGYLFGSNTYKSKNDVDGYVDGNVNDDVGNFELNSESELGSQFLFY